ncbi:MAG: hypothetical protein ACRYGG_11465 [Janthinobacterium lividum]
MHDENTFTARLPSKKAKQIDKIFAEDKLENNEIYNTNDKDEIDKVQPKMEDDQKVGVNKKVKRDNSKYKRWKFTCPYCYPQIAEPLFSPFLDMSKIITVIAKNPMQKIKQKYDCNHIKLFTEKINLNK